MPKLVVRCLLAVTMGACAIDESGLAPVDASVDVTAADARTDSATDAGPPPSCASLDATACVDAAIPDGWSPVALTIADASCPSDYTPGAFVTNVALDDAGACTCGCTPTGSYTCAGQIAVGANNMGNCDVHGTFDGGDVPGCFPPVAGSHHISVGPLPSPVSVGAGCDASTSPATWHGTAVTACGPSCTADYCGLGAPFSRCIVSSTQTTCPAPFQPKGRIGSPSAVVATCASCSCSITPPGACSATVTAYDQAGCTGNPASVTPDGTCQQPFTFSNVGSFKYVPSVPSVACTPDASGASSAVLGSPLTVCCLP